MNVTHDSFTIERTLDASPERVVSGKKISTSLATFVIERVGSKTRLVLTEQGVYFGEGHDKHNAMRREGTEGLLDRLVAFVGR